MLEERKAAILKAVVEEYISTAQPVGSTSISGAPGIEVSPATVRNEMLQLERQGYLHQPHTSAGRVPTEKGYRFFVDALGPGSELDQTQQHQVAAFFDHSHGELERLLHETTGLLSELTSYAAVVVGPGARAATVRSVQLVRVTSHVAMVVAVLSNGGVEKAVLELNDDDGDDEISAVSAALHAALVNHTLDAAVDAPASLVPSAQALFERASTAFDHVAEAEPDHVFVGGTARMARSFDAVQTVQHVLDILEQQLVVVTLLRDVIDRGLSVAIGTETGVQPLSECSLIVAPYRVEGHNVGSIGVLGPTRMNYPQALSAVAVVSQALGERLSED